MSTVIPEEVAKGLVSLYLSGLSPEEVAIRSKSLGHPVAPRTVRHVLRREGIKARGENTEQVRLNVERKTLPPHKPYGHGLPLWMIGCGCHFPTGWSAEAGHLFCGDPQGDRKPYCTKHAAVAFTTASANRSIRDERDRQRKEFIAAIRKKEALVSA